MASYRLDVYMPVLILFVLGALFVLGTLLIGKLVRPDNPDKKKLSPYECGEEPVGSAWSSYNVRFYVVALIFIIFDVESALMMPVVSVFKKMNAEGMGGVILFEIILFLLVLVSGMAYCWRKGDLDWIKSFQAPSKGRK